MDEKNTTKVRFQANVKTTRINQVTKHPEPFLPGWNKVGRLIFTNSFVVFLVSRHYLLISHLIVFYFE